MTNLNKLLSYSKALAKPFVNTKRLRTAATVLKAHGPRVFTVELCKLIKYDYSVVRRMHTITENIAEYRQRNKYNMYVLFISHELSLTGAPRAVLQACRAVQQAGGYSVVVSLQDGPLKRELEELDIPIIISTDYIEESPELLTFASTFHVVFASTVITHKAVLHLQNTLPVIWRIAEGRTIAEEYITSFPELEHALQTAHNIYAVSEYSASYVEKYNKNVKVLYLGLPDVYGRYASRMENSNSIRFKNRLAFCMIGTVAKRKAQDVLIDAVLQIPEAYRRKAVFHLVGKVAGPGFGERMRERARDIREIIFHGELADEAKYEVLLNSDALICISRDDPNPQVVMEGMMFRKPCIVSENVGQRRLIVDGVSGFVTKTEDSESLCGLIIKILDNPELLDPMREQSRQIYSHNFTEERFNRELINILNNVIPSSNRAADLAGVAASRSR